MKHSIVVYELLMSTWIIGNQAGIMKRVFAVCVALTCMLYTTEAQQVCLADIALVIDHSGSIQDQDPGNWHKMTTFLKRFVVGLDIAPMGTHVAAVGFGNRATLFFGLLKYQTVDQVLRGVDVDIVYKGGNTNTTGGLWFTRTVVLGLEARANFPTIIVLVTDGNPTREVEGLKAEATTVKSQGIRILGVGVTGNVDEAKLKEEVISEPVDQNYFSVDGFDQLNGIIDSLNQQVCSTLEPPMTNLTTTTQPPPGGSSTVATPQPEVEDACSVDRGGCDQYCTSSGPNVTCVCSDSFVLSSFDNKICDDPCEKDNGGCHQLCSVSNHQVVCACYDGYTVNPDDDILCIEKDECLAVDCRNGGTCVDLINRFFCDCVDGWIGETCDQKAKADPVLISMHQDKGPVAGGTRITLRGRDFIKGALLTLGESIQCSFNIQESNSTVAILTTPAVRTEEANKDLSVTVRFPGYEILQTDFTFTYKANPTIQSVYPLKANVIGGTSFTVKGEALDIVSDSRIEITMVHKYTEMGITKTNTTLYQSTCDVKVSTSMNCLAPKVDIPPSSRSVEEETDQTIVTEKETLDFFLGFRLDGVPAYTNLSDTRDLIDYRKISYLTEEPEVFQSSFNPFVPNSGATISIKGSGFLQGFEPSDYRVAIGSGWCRDLDVTDNEIICAPPDILSGINSKRKKRGTDTDSDYIYRDGERPKRATREVDAEVIVHAGTNLQINAGTITYLINETTVQKPNRASISAGVAMTTVLGVLAGWMLA